eukprot:CAMPEP_0206419560 /NCGR_PEP_ID=MMETSP0324_2-20121206/217_1 /ASSEMBLY_ACC=CAM_ASM_000836 /TAXON_ID=2866 /ORGANISM="Crypthecodinium cohnii, Strain Seligo" /LENGTH=76 /DNA_ID=CAMNT_0053883071 /DNA_START=325 /DNA_END=552 /DNA_ORIENTATION=+
MAQTKPSGQQGMDGASSNNTNNFPNEDLRPQLDSDGSGRSHLLLEFSATCPAIVVPSCLHDQFPTQPIPIDLLVNA